MASMEDRVLAEFARITAERKLELTYSDGKHQRTAYAMDGFEARLFFTYAFYASTATVRFGGPAAEAWHEAHPDAGHWYERRINASMSYSGHDSTMQGIPAVLDLYRELLGYPHVEPRITPERDPLYAILFNPRSDEGRKLWDALKDGQSVYTIPNPYCPQDLPTGYVLGHYEGWPLQAKTARTQIVEDGPADLGNLQRDADGKRLNYRIVLDRLTPEAASRRGWQRNIANVLGPRKPTRQPYQGVTWIELLPDEENQP